VRDDEIEPREFTFNNRTEADWSRTGRAFCVATCCSGASVAHKLIDAALTPFTTRGGVWSPSFALPTGTNADHNVNLD